MFSHRLGLAVVIFSLAVASHAAAQTVPVLPFEIVSKKIELSAPYVPKLREDHASGDLKALTERAKTLLFEIGSLKVIDQCCNYETNYFEVVFVSRDEKGTDTLARVLVHDPDPERNVLPGLKGNDADDVFYTVFIDESEHVNFRAVFELERVENPLVKETADFVTSVIGKGAYPLASAQKNFEGQQAANAAAGELTYNTAITVMKTAFPHRRAKLTSKLFAREAAMADSVVIRAAYLAKRESDGVERGPAAASCGPLAVALREAVTAAVGASCGVEKTDDECVKAIKASVPTVFVAKGAACQNAAVITRAFLALAQSAPRFLSTSTSLTNTPKRFLGFSLGTAFIGEVEPDADQPRTKLSNGTIVLDTFPRLMVQGLVNLTWPYVPDTFRPGWAESIRFQVGVPFAPYFGVSAGFGVLLTRQLGLNFGKAWLWYDTPKAGAAAIDTKPTGPEAATPFKFGRTSVLFGGVTYTFTK